MWPKNDTRNYSYNVNLQIICLLLSTPISLTQNLSFKDAKLLSRIISKFMLGTLIYGNDNDRVSYVEHCIATVSTSINFSPSLSQVPSSLLHDILSTKDNFSVSLLYGYLLLPYTILLYMSHVKWSFCIFPFLSD